jgi:hypothetical protein
MLPYVHMLSGFRAGCSPEVTVLCVGDVKTQRPVASTIPYLLGNIPAVLKVHCNI